MRTTAIVFLTLTFFSTHLFAQIRPDADTIVPSKGNIEQQLKAIRKRQVLLYSDSAGAGNVPKKSGAIDSTKKNRYNNLLEDDPQYNKKYPLWVPAVEVVAMNAILNIVDRSVYNLNFAKVDLHSWGRTTKAGFPWSSGWIWDQDRFGNNFLSHPMTGSFYYNAARSNGYNYWQSAPIVFAGSYMWKIFG